VPTTADRRELRHPAGVQVTWVPRAGRTAVPGVAALATLHEHAAPGNYDYGYVVGESTLATRARRQMHRLGLPKDRITFSGYWRHSSTPEHA